MDCTHVLLFFLLRRNGFATYLQKENTLKNAGEEEE